MCFMFFCASHRSRGSQASGDLYDHGIVSDPALTMSRQPIASPRRGLDDTYRQALTPGRSRLHSGLQYTLAYTEPSIRVDRGA
jgi:hypothetical protein